jgi:hypothetical protein
MYSSSDSGRKGFVLLTLLPIVLVLILFLGVYSLEIYRQSVQQRLLTSMDRFSLVEMTVIHQTIRQFLTYDPQDFDLELGGYKIKVSFEDETATIIYDESEELYGIMSFDLVFGYVTQYRLERNGDSD